VLALLVHAALLGFLLIGALARLPFTLLVLLAGLLVLLIVLPILAALLLLLLAAAAAFVITLVHRSLSWVSRGVCLKPTCKENERFGPYVSGLAPKG
jgi:hypothetical protein